MEASAQSGCIDFTALGANVESYHIDDDFHNPGRRVVRADRDAKLARRAAAASPEPAWKAVQAAAQKASKSAVLSGSLSPQWDPNAHVNAGFGHGMETERWGKSWKWQQVALGISSTFPCA